MNYGFEEKKVGNETLKRLNEAFLEDKVVVELKERFETIMAYQSTPFSNQPPHCAQHILNMIASYKASAYPFLREQTFRSDMSMAWEFSFVIQKRIKLLSTKKKSKLTVLEGIDLRLSLYIEYLRDRLYYTDYNLPEYPDCIKIGLFSWSRIPYALFSHWLYFKHYEELLSDIEFLDAIDYYDKK